MGWVRVEPTGDITLRESGLTSIWSCITREFGQPSEERRQMTAVVTLTGALSDRLTARRLQARMVKVVSQPGVRRGTTAFRKERSQGLSGMQGNLHVPFLGGWVGAIPPGYPADEETGLCRPRFVATQLECEHFTLAPGDVAVADRGYAQCQGMQAAVAQGADLIVRLNPFSVVLSAAAGVPLELCVTLKRQQTAT